MDKAYKIKRNLKHLKSNQDYDVWQITKDEKEKFNELFWRLEPFDELPPYDIEGQLERLRWLDYPDSNPNYPIVSKKFIETINSVGNFKHNVLPLIIHDWKLKTLTTDNFVFLHLLEEVNVIDKEKSVYYDTERIRKPALKEPTNGYPPLFRVRDYGLTWFVSASAKEALEKADIKGVSFPRLIAS